MINTKDIKEGHLQVSIKDKQDTELVHNKLLPQYSEYKHVFSKTALDKFPLDQSYNHKIKLTANNNLIKSLLWNQTADKLRATKKYLIKHLGKKFILAS